MKKEIFIRQRVCQKHSCCLHHQGRERQYLDQVIIQPAPIKNLFIVFEQLNKALYPVKDKEYDRPSKLILYVNDITIPKTTKLLQKWVKII